MSAELYNQIYRCRKCSKEFCPVKTCDREKANEHMVNLMNRVNGKRTVHLQLAPVLYMTHYCENGHIGMADFIGYERREI